MKTTLLTPLLLGTAAATAAKEVPKLNFILIMADDMGYGDLGCYGNRTISTPNIDRMAAEGVRFADFHSNGAASTPTRAALLTGRYQQRAGLQGVHMTWEESTKNIGLQPEEITFAKVLSRNGYKTALFGKWHLGSTDEVSPNRRGFDRFVGFRGGNIDYINHRDVEGYEDWWFDMEFRPEKGYATHLIANHTCDYIRANADKPFCIYVAHAVPHHPYQGPDDPEFRVPGKEKLQHHAPRKDHDTAYKEMIENLDLTIGQLFKTLKETELDKHTVVFFISDNGAVGPGSVGGLNGRKGQLLEGGHRVPGIVWGLGKGIICDQPVMTMDLFPTMISLAGIEYDDSKKPLDGISLAPLLIEQRSLPARDLFWRNKNQMAIRSGDWKLILYRNKNAPVKRMLFDLGRDLAEQNNLAETHPAKVAELTAKIQSWEKSVDAEIQEQINN